MCVKRLMEVPSVLFGVCALADELKTIKFQMMLSPSEAEAIDDWGFASRIRSRAEAIRRLVQVGLIANERVPNIFHELAACYSAVSNIVTSRVLADRKDDLGEAEARLLGEIGEQMRTLEDIALQIEAFAAQIQALTGSGDLGAAMERAREARREIDEWRNGINLDHQDAKK